MEDATGVVRASATVIVFCIVLIALAWAALAFELKSDRERTVARVTEANGNLARTFEEDVRRTLRNADRALLAVKSKAESAPGAFDLVQFARDAKLDQQPFNILTIADASGRIVQATVPFAPTSLADREFFRYHALHPAGGLDISKPLVGRTTGKPTLYLSRRLDARDGAFAGMVVVGLDPRHFSDFYNQIELGAGGVITLVGRDGIVRARQSDANSEVGQDISGARAFALLNFSRPGEMQGSYVKTSTVDNVTRIISYRALTDYPLVILVGSAEGTALASFRERKAAYRWTAGMITVVILLFGILLLFQTQGQARLARRLREAEARARLAVESVADYAIITLDKRGRVTSWNAGAERIKGYREEEILGEHLSRFYPPEDIELRTPQRELEEAAAKGTTEQEGWRVRKNGSRFWAHVVVTALRNKAGGLAGFGKITRDLTLSKLTEDALNRSEARYRAIFDQAAVGIGEVSTEGRWLRANAKLCQIIGYPMDELLRLNIRDCTHPEDLAATDAHALNVRAGRGVSQYLEKRYVRKDGSVVWIALSSVLVEDPAGESDYIVGVVDDISARKSAETRAGELHARLGQLVDERTSELAEANKRLESFSYSVSHDLRTPLRAISGFAQILARRHRESLNEEGRHYMDNIVRASAQMGRLIEDLLTYSRLGRKSIALQPVALAEVIGELVRHLEPRTVDLLAEIRLPDNLPRVRGDATLLTQIFLNLFDNALTYHRPGVAPIIEVTSREHGGTVTVTVRDNGIGIRPEHFETIFGIFQRLHGEDEYPGTGIGLATVRQSAEMLGGKVWLESVPGTGSTFHVELAAAT